MESVVLALPYLLMDAEAAVVQPLSLSNLDNAEFIGCSHRHVRCVSPFVAISCSRNECYKVSSQFVMAMNLIVLIRPITLAL